MTRRNLNNDGKIGKAGGHERARGARSDIRAIYNDPDHPLYLAKDIILANKFNISRHTIYKIRDEIKVPPRSKRILMRLQLMDTRPLSIGQIARKLSSDVVDIKYQNLYKIINDNNIPIKRSDLTGGSPM